MPTAALHTGMKVTPDPTSPYVRSETVGRVFTVTKINPKNVRCTADDGGRGLNYPRELLVPATPENLAKAQDPARLSRPFVPRELYALGEVVTLKRAYRQYDTQAPFVVIGSTPNRTKVAPLGGNNDEYLLIPAGGLERRVLASWRLA